MRGLNLCVALTFLVIHSICLYFTKYMFAHVLDASSNWVYRSTVTNWQALADKKGFHDHNDWASMMII